MLSWGGDQPCDSFPPALRQPFSSRRQNTSSLSSRRRQDSCSRIHSSSASSRYRMENPPSSTLPFSSVCAYPNQTTNLGCMGGYPYLVHRTRLLLAWACFFICEGQRSRLWRKQATVLESKSILLFLAFGYLVDLQNEFSSMNPPVSGGFGELQDLWMCYGCVN